MYVTCVMHCILVSVTINYNKSFRTAYSSSFTDSVLINQSYQIFAVLVSPLLQTTLRLH